MDIFETAIIFARSDQSPFILGLSLIAESTAVFLRQNCYQHVVLRFLRCWAFRGFSLKTVSFLWRLDLTLAVLDRFGAYIEADGSFQRELWFIGLKAN